MKLKELFSWKSLHSVFSTPISENFPTPPQGQASRVGPSSPSVGDVANFPSSVIGEYNTAQIFNTEANYERSGGLINAPELIAFFKVDYYAIGRHAGAMFKSHAALELGRNLIISQFQNILAALIEQKEEKICKLQDQLIEIEGVDPSMSNRLSLAQEYMGKEIIELREQFEKAAKGTGWVLEPLNRYQIGFRDGLRATTLPKY
jgi:hypothetical protein